MEENPHFSMVDLNHFPAVQEKEGYQETDSNQQLFQQVAEVPDLALNLQAINISAPRFCSLQATQVEQNQEIQEKFMLLMKVACTGGMPRVISEHAVSQAMARAWRQHFYAISQVSTNLYGIFQFSGGYVICLHSSAMDDGYGQFAFGVG